MDPIVFIIISRLVNIYGSITIDYLFGSFILYIDGSIINY